METEEKCKKLYNTGLWVRIFTSIRFWTSSFVQIEESVPKNGKILDLGCGYGIFGNYLALSSGKRRIIGVDTDRNKVESANKNISNASFLVGDATRKKINNLNAITILDVLHHLNSYEDQEKLIESCRRMLIRGGSLIISDVNNTPFWKLILARLTDFLMYKGAPVYYRYKKDMIKMLNKHFKNIEICDLENNPFPHVLYICRKN
jgi:2-polyprenyl-3-methyl-5-hydroxy-6-metoxy-1,4-benzoquinol methylase